jgi:hypothetical protein
MSLEAYFTQVRQLMQSVPAAHVERYEEQVLSTNRGNLRIRLRFEDHALLEISEALVFVAGRLQWLSYRYHYQDPSEALVFRYDNAPHHSEIPTYPDHKHIGEHVLASVHPSIEQVLREVQVFRDRTGSEW